MIPRVFVAFVLLVPAASMAADDPAMARALRVLAAHPVIDGHNDLPWAIRENEKAPRDVAAYDIRGRAPAPPTSRASRPAASAASSGPSTRPGNIATQDTRGSSSSR